MKEEQINEFRKVLESIYKDSSDTHSIYTPLSLCEEMINSIDSLDGNILIISNLEFILAIKKTGINLSNIHYTTSCDIKKIAAQKLGLDINNIYDLDYNKKEVNLGTDMKFDVIVMNSPYNPNSLWKKFTLKAIDLLKDDGQMVAIHPSAWRDSMTHKKLAQHFKKHISKLVVNDYEVWKEQKVATKTDWYIYNKQEADSTEITYSNGDTEILNLKEHEMVFRFSTNSIPYNIFKKITKSDYNNGIIMEKGFNSLYKPEHHFDDGKYKQCGGSGNGTGWTNGKFIFTNEPSKYQFDNKIIMSYAGKPRAQYFSKEEETGCLLGNIFLTDNIKSTPNSIVLLYNSEMFWKIICKIVDPDVDQYKPYGTMSQIPSWYLKIINIDNCHFINDDEMYEHYGLTEEEINFCES